MLRSLSIQNIAVIQSAEISFTNGFNVFTGETGAGKSILIGAIGAILGSRTSKELIRTGEKKASIAALFSPISPAVLALLTEYGLSAEEELLLSREITADGNSCRINGQPATVAMLRSLGERLIHTHGQDDTHLLAQEETHLQFVDDFGNLSELRCKCNQLYTDWNEIRTALSRLTINEAEKARKIDLLTYQINEIRAANLVDGEEEELLARRKMIRNAEDILSLLSTARDLLAGGEELPGIVAALDGVGDALSSVGSFLPDFSDTAERVESFRYELEEISSSLREQLESFSFDPQELEDIEERLHIIAQLRRKYGSDIAEILAFADRAEAQVAEIESLDAQVLELTAREQETFAVATEAANRLSDARKTAAVGFIAAVKAELSQLDMPYVEMEVRFSAKPLGETGADAAEFLLSVNPGEARKPLAKTASGGEMSRIMLGIKNVLSGKEEIPTLIFDEIDAGISGRAAQKVGKKLAEAAQERQIICVTHLAQVAVFGNRHLLIQKEVADQRTFTRITPIEGEARAKEIARIMNGEPITPLALTAATELLASVHTHREG